MNRLTKVDVKTALSLDNLRRMVVDCFGVGSEIQAMVELSGGLFNTAYAIRVTGRPYETVLRIAPSGKAGLLTYEHDLMRREVEVYNLLDQQTTIPMPELYCYNFRHDIIDSDYMFVSKLRGVPLKDVIDLLPATAYSRLAYRFGQYAAQIHALQGTYFGYVGAEANPASGSWRSAFLHMVADVLGDARAYTAPLPMPYDDIYARFERQADVLDEITVPHLIHGDLWDANVFVREGEAGWKIEGIIDCDRAIWGDPEMEYSLYFRGDGGPFFEGYGRTLSDTPAARIRQQMYLAYFYLIVCVETHARLQETDRAAWAQGQLTSALEALRKFG